MSLTIRLRYPSIPQVEIDCSAVDGAALLFALSQLEQESPPIQEDHPEPTGGSSGAQAPARSKSPPQAPPSPSPDAKSSAKFSPPARPYRGKTNRRQLVLDVLCYLGGKGSHEPTLQEIQTAFQQLFPHEHTRHLDQVVRDMANKTGLLEHCGRGKFRLVGGQEQPD